MSRIVRRPRILFGMFLCRARMARIRWKMAGEIKSPKWSRAFLYYAGLNYASVIIVTPMILARAPSPPQNLLQVATENGLGVMVLVASLLLIQIGKELSDPKTQRLVGDLRFQYVQEKVRLKLLKQQW